MLIIINFLINDPFNLHHIPLEYRIIPFFLPFLRRSSYSSRFFHSVSPHVGTSIKSKVLIHKRNESKKKSKKKGKKIVKVV